MLINYNGKYISVDCWHINDVVHNSFRTGAFMKYCLTHAFCDSCLLFSIKDLTDSGGRLFSIGGRDLILVDEEVP